MRVVQCIPIGYLQQRGKTNNGHMIYFMSGIKLFFLEITSFLKQYERVVNGKEMKALHV